MASFAPPLADDPLVLLVPGLHDSGPGHWQTRWESERDDCRRVELGRWSDPIRNLWVNRLNLALQRATRPVVLVAHSLGCHAVAWWAEYERPGFGDPVVGALLVAPPDVDDPATDPRLRRFAPTPESELPFPTILAASRDDPWLPIGKARRLARTWGARFADVGHAGHINAASNVGSWPFGQFLLARLIGRAEFEATRSEAEPSLGAPPAALLELAGSRAPSSFAAHQ